MAIDVDFCTFSASSRREGQHTKMHVSRHTHRDSPGGSTLRGQRTIWPHNKDRCTCFN